MDFSRAITYHLPLTQVLCTLEDNLSRATTIEVPHCICIASTTPHLDNRLRSTYCKVKQALTRANPASAQLLLYPSRLSRSFFFRQVLLVHVSFTFSFLLILHLLLSSLFSRIQKTSFSTPKGPHRRLAPTTAIIGAISSSSSIASVSHVF